MNISFDLDGCLYDWHDAVYTHENPDVSFEKFWTEINRFYSNLGQENLIRIRHLYNFKTIDPLNLQLLRDLDKRGDSIFYITARPKEMKLDTEVWLKRNHLPQKENLIFSKDKTIPITLNKINYHIDDNKRTALECSKYTNIILVKKPWNIDICNDFICVHDVYEIRDLIF